MNSQVNCYIEMFIFLYQIISEKNILKISLGIELINSLLRRTAYVCYYVFHL